MFAAKRRITPFVRLLGVVLSGLLVLTMAAAAANQRPAGAEVPFAYRTSDPLAVDAPTPDALAFVEDAVAPALPVFATFDGVQLHLPSARTLLVGFHEASRREALPFAPTGRGLSNENTTKTTLPLDVAGPEYHVMSSRGRRQPATSAVDLVLDPDEPVLTLVTGTVVDVRPYLLEGRYADTRVEIAPQGRPDLRVVVIHISGVLVETGDLVIAGQTVMANSPTSFPFSSQIDRYLDNRYPHVHVEIKPAGAPRPGDLLEETEAAG